jgi:ABC-type polysaccharide/polyol phosphate transport system ATPase subunit
MKRIIVENISKKFKIGFKKNQSALANIISVFSGREPKKIIWALKNVSFQAQAGEIIGIIGENGSGKSTLFRIIAGIYNQEEGKIKIDGTLISLINLYVGLKERLTMKENIYLIGSLFGLSIKEIKKRFNSIVKFAELENFVNTKIYQFSLGMMERLTFSIASHSDPEILLLDEAFEIGDENFKKKSAKKITELVKRGATVILVSHELWLIEKYCDKIIWLDKGEIIKQGEPKEIIKEYTSA